MRVNILAQDITEWHGSATPAQARLYANKQFTAIDDDTDVEVIVAPGSRRRPEYYQPFTVTLVSNNVHIAAGDAFATIDSSDPSASYTLDLYDSNGRFLKNIFSRLRIPADPKETTWDDIREYSRLPANMTADPARPTTLQAYVDQQIALLRAEVELYARALIFDEPYENTWDADTTHAASRNALWDKFQAVAAAILLMIEDGAYDAQVWAAQHQTGASKAALAAEFETRESLSNKITEINPFIPYGDDEYPTAAATKTYAENLAGTALSTAEAYADALVVSMLDDRGNYNASGNVFPSSGGSGPAGSVAKGDLWTISVAGTLGGQAVTAGDVVRSKVDGPGQTAGNWVITENNFGYVAENSANKDTDGTLAANSDTKYASQKAVKTYADTKLPKTDRLLDIDLAGSTHITGNLADATFGTSNLGLTVAAGTTYKFRLRASVGVTNEGFKCDFGGTATFTLFRAQYYLEDSTGARVAASQLTAAGNDFNFTTTGVSGTYNLVIEGEFLVNAGGTMNLRAACYIFIAQFVEILDGSFSVEKYNP
jgi:hypothetical protein